MVARWCLRFAVWLREGDGGDGEKAVCAMLFMKSKIELIFNSRSEVKNSKISKYLKLILSSIQENLLKIQKLENDSVCSILHC